MYMYMSQNRPCDPLKKIKILESCVQVGLEVVSFKFYSVEDLIFPSLACFQFLSWVSVSIICFKLYSFYHCQQFSVNFHLVIFGELFFAVFCIH